MVTRNDTKLISGSNFCNAATKNLTGLLFVLMLDASKHN